MVARDAVAASNLLRLSIAIIAQQRTLYTPNMVQTLRDEQAPTHSSIASTKSRAMCGVRKP